MTDVSEFEDIDPIDEGDPEEPWDRRMTKLPIAAIKRRLEAAGDKEAVEAIQHLQYVIWQHVAYEDSYGVPNSSWDCCDICGQAEAGPGKFATGVKHLPVCPLFEWMD